MRTDRLTVISVWTRIHNDRIHKQKLRQINQRAAASPQASAAEHFKHLQRGASQQVKERARELTAKNMKLFQKLNELMDGRNSASSPFRQAALTEPLGPKSLNYSAKKQEIERIQRDNHVMARRLSEQQSTLKVKNFNETHRQNCKYKTQISRTLRYKKLLSLEQKVSHVAVFCQTPRTARRAQSPGQQSSRLSQTLKDDLPHVQEEQVEQPVA